MLPEEQRLEILAEMARYPDPRAASVEALKVIQRSNRWVSDEALAGAAELLGMSVDELDNVATFYNLIFRRPVGEHVILVCNSVSCWIVGCAGLCAALEKYLGIGFGQTTQDGRFTLLPIVCLGACDRAPVMMVDEDLHGPVEAKDLDEILSRYPRRSD